MKAFKVYVDFKQPLDKNKAHGILYKADGHLGCLIAENKTEAYNQIHESAKCMELPDGIYYQLRLEEIRLQEFINS